MLTSALRCLFMLISLNAIAQPAKIDSLTLELDKAAPDTNKVIIYRMLTGLVRNTDPLKAVEYGKAGVALGKKLNFDKGTAGCLLNISACYISASRLDDALLYIDSAIDYSYKAGDPNRLALAYLNRADIHMQMQNLNQSLVDCDSSLRYANIAESDDRRARIFQTIGSVYFFQENYKMCVTYYDKALVLYRKINNQQMAALVLNNLGNAYKAQLNYSKAIDAFLTAIETGKQQNDVNNLSMYHENLSDVYLQANKINEAEKYASLAMEYARQQQNNVQIANAYECQGRIFLQQKKYMNAIRVGELAYELGLQENSLTLRHEASDLLAKAYEEGGSPSKAYEYLRINKQISDSMLRQQFDEDIAKMQTRFNVNEKDNQILRLENERLVQQQKLRQTQYLFFASGAIGLLGLLGVVLLINRYRLQQRMKELELRNRIAADLHDEVGSSLSSIHMLSQMAAKKQAVDTGQQELLGKMSLHAKETMDKMGDIVWMIKPGENESFSLKQRMENFAYEILGSQDIDTVIDLEVIESWKLSMEKRRNVYLVFKEAVNNAAKYSGAEKVAIKAWGEGKQMFLQVSDFGKGFDPSQVEEGNGLGNMANRAKEMGGTVEINATTGEGTTVKLSIPV